MFTIEQIKTAHAKVKSGADFPAYIQELKQLSVILYNNYVTDGHTDYYGTNIYKISAPGKYPVKSISDKASAEQLQHSLRIHQQGQTDYMTFCRQVAEAGVEKWTVDIMELTCTYYDKAGNKMITEEIPGKA